jgi:hypothetical protein
MQKLHNSTIALLTLVLATGLLSSCSRVNKDNQMLRIGKGGNMNSIVIPEKPDSIVNFAAAELKSYIKKITGRELHIQRRSDTKLRSNEIHLVVDNNINLKWDGFKIDITGKGICLTSAESRGLLYSVYTLLEKMGCSFFYPGEEEIVPELNNLTLSAGTLIYNPVLEHRGLAPYGLYAGTVEMGRMFFDWMAKNKLNYVLVSENRPSDADGQGHASIWKEVQEKLLPELQKRGFIIEMSEHCTPVFFPRSLYQDHPDWFAMNNGVRKLGPPPYSGQMCYSNKDAVEYYANAIAAYAEKHPEFHVIGTWPLDGGEYCECEKCKDSETVFKAAMHVAEKVKQVRPDIIVEHLAYHQQTWQPPSMDKIPANMSVLWCPDAGAMDSLAVKWIEKARDAGGVYQFEYYMGDNYRTRANVWLRPEYSAGVARYAKTIGFRGVISLCITIDSWWRSSFNNCFFARACWDPDLDIDAYLREYCNRYYGDQAEQVKETFEMIFRDLQPEPYADQVKSAPQRLEQVKSAAGVILNKLDNISSRTEDPAVKKRIMRLRTYVEYFRMHCEAMIERNPDDLKKIADYSRNHPEQQMVLMYPEYIIWRNAD